MNQFVRQLFGTLFQRQLSSPIARLQPPHSFTSPEKWCEYWQMKSLGWARTEPEFDRKRQEELSKHLVITPIVEKCIYPFRGMKLSRADFQETVKWLSMVILFEV